jgi:hypothetical protein
LHRFCTSLSAPNLVAETGKRNPSGVPSGLRGLGYRSATRGVGSGAG